MPVYRPQTEESIHLYAVLACPYCSYSSPSIKYRSQMLNHIKKCNEHEQENDNIEDDNCNDGEETVKYYLDWRINLINTIKKFIRTNELALINTQTPEQIRLYIKNKLLENITIDRRIDLDTFWIYRHFFEMNDIENKKLDEVMEQYYEPVTNWALQADHAAST
jgi:hypothetical protein